MIEYGLLASKSYNFLEQLRDLWDSIPLGKTVAIGLGIVFVLYLLNRGR